jgi:phosphopantothenoylcysteine decarboxylase/phosphopantothenate--cysteine ligase
VRIALGISGGIAAYKACEVIRGLDRAGVEVQVILTRNATNFVTPLTLQTLSRRRVLLEQFDLSQAETIQHIDLTRSISALVVAPATANVIGKFASGVADDLLSTFYSAVTAPVVLAPAMNTRMWLHSATQENIARLKRRAVEIVEPESGWLAEGETGWGRLAEPERIVEATLSAARRSNQLAGKSILVTAGPTREPLDPVRFLSNRSSGRMGYALAAAGARRGAEITLVSGPVDLAVPFGVRRVDVETSTEMREAILGHRERADALFMAAAVSDYVPQARKTKIKKRGGPLDLRLDEGPDILAELGKQRREGLLIGFAAETDSLIENAREKLERKNLDFIVANDVSVEGIGIDAEENRVTVLSREGARWEVDRAPKGVVAEKILDLVFGNGAAGSAE